MHATPHVPHIAGALALLAYASFTRAFGHGRLDVTHDPAAGVKVTSHQCVAMDELGARRGDGLARRPAPNRAAAVLGYSRAHTGMRTSSGERR